MSYWILPTPLSDEAQAIALERQELVLASEGMADLARAQGQDQISNWLRNLKPEATPEHISVLAQHFWRLGHELLPEDTIIVRTHDGRNYSIGEIAGSYRRETRNGMMSHIWPVMWGATDIPADSLPMLSQYAGGEGITEITNEKALESLKPYIPALRKGNTSFFKWIGIIILVFELIYFWPHG